MTNRVHALRALVATLALSSPTLASPYTLELTGEGDGANNGTVYFEPYVGSIRNSSNEVIYSGYLICDDFNTESKVGSSWGATETDAGNLNGLEKFAGETYLFDGTKNETAQMYDAAAYLANELLQPGNVTNWAAQGSLSFAIWDIMDGTVPASGSTTWTDIGDAFAAVNSGYVGSNVEVYTADRSMLRMNSSSSMARPFLSLRRSGSVPSDSPRSSALARNAGSGSWYAHAERWRVRPSALTAGWRDLRTEGTPR